MQGLLDLISSRVRPNEMAMFFWKQLKHDINIISMATGKSQDEVCLLLHMILKEIATKDPPHSEYEIYSLALLYLYRSRYGNICYIECQKCKSTVGSTL